MNNGDHNKFILFAENTQAVKKEFKWQDTLTKRLAALLYAIENKPVDCEAIHESRTLIKKNTGVFSKFRGNMSLCVAAMLSLKDNRQEIFSDTLNVYDMMKKAKFRASDYLAVASYQIAAHAEHDKIQEAVNRTKEFYNGMKSNRWLHTGQDDYIFAAMLGLSDMDVKTSVDKIENLYQRLKPHFWAKNSVQTLAQILILSGECDKAVNRVLELREALKEQRLRLDKTSTLPAMGVLALLPVNIDIIVQDIIYAKDFLRNQKGFGSLYLSTQELLLLVSSIVAAEYAEEMNDGVITASLSTSIASIIIAQQTAVIMAAVSAGAIAASSSSN
jgi:uncharacterized protein CbrC (UPF0167 family)